ncbi:MAG TPA: DNA repair protein RecN [Gemmatimonadaceae bacterium]|nr:DNA repair protein RecN [Gemmatimonadaceae bacterium]
MLTELRIRNFAIIESLTLPLAPGFNVLSGETGAGKSIIVGALGLLLGERASADLIRTGADRAVVEGVFDVGEETEVARMLDDRGIELEEGRVVLRREIAVAGRTRAWINDTTTTAAALAEIGRALVNLHGQHEAQALLDEESQRAILDAFAGATEQASKVASAHRSLSDTTREIETLAARRADAERRADYLRHVVREIDEAKLHEGEDVTLEEEARRLENADELRSSAAGMVALLDGSDEAVLHAVAQVQRMLAHVQKIDPSASRLQELLDGAFYSLEELARQLSEYEESIDLDPARLGEVQRRRDLLFRLTKKYGPTISDALRVAREAREELSLVDGAGFDLKALEARREEARTRLAEEARRLTTLRTAAAERLSRAVDEVLPDLGMESGRFTVKLTPRDPIQPTGAEDVQYLVTLNVGHEARPLAKVASGGELSRVMLALKTILARLDQVPTLVFDEVDAGIGGRVGLQVGETLRRVAQHHQVFAITHLPQIAARAHHHIVVTKGARSGVTAADVTVLSADDRVSEIARMLGGDAESEISRAHARELLQTAAKGGQGGQGGRGSRGARGARGR